MFQVQIEDTNIRQHPGTCTANGVLESLHETTNDAKQLQNPGVTHPDTQSTAIQGNAEQVSTGLLQHGGLPNITWRRTSSYPSQ